MSFSTSVKYSKLTDLDADDGSSVLQIKNMEKKDQCFEFDSIYSYDNDKRNFNGQPKNAYNSVFKYNTMVAGRPSGHLAVDVREDRPEPNPSNVLKATSLILTFLSYLFFVLTLPLTYWIFVKKLGEFDRLVVFRLGKMVGVKGPGRVVIFPWMDRTKKVDVRAAAFSVPPQQFITCDGGILEMGAEIQYGIVDVVTMVSEVADHQDILRSLSKTLLIKILVKKTVRQVEKERRRPAAEIQDEINLQVRKWGIDVQKVELSEPKILKQPESGSNSAVGTILKGLGMKSEAKYPTPQEFVRITHGLAEEEPSSTTQIASALGGSVLGSNSGSSAGNSANMNVSLLQMMTNNMSRGSTTPASSSTLPEDGGLPGKVVLPTDGPAIDPQVFSWGKCLEVILENDLAGLIDDEACGLYKIEITETHVGTDTYFISLSQEAKKLHQGVVSPDGRQPDVTVQIASSDLASVLEGTLAPLQAYLLGRISASGDVRKLMLFDKLSKRGHKPGTMFNV